MTAHVQRLVNRPAPDAAGRFLLRALFWNIALFGLLRLEWIETHVIGAVVEFQKSLVMWYGFAEHKGLIVNASCSGTDLMALCIGVTLAYPAVWSRRLIGAAVGLTLILTLNMVRIESLYLVMTDPARFQLLHLYVWPIALVLVTVAYVLAWIRWSDRDRRSAVIDQRWRRFGLFAGAALAAYAASLPWAFKSSALVEVGAWTVRAGAVMLSAFGVSAQTMGNVLLSARGGFQVTPECLFTPMIPLYGAALCAWPMPLGRRLGWLALGVPLFFALGVARLLAVALPPFVAASPLHLAHGFYQFVAGAALLVAAAHWANRHEPAARSSWASVSALGLALAVGLVAAAPWRIAVEWMTGLPLTRAGDPQGALALMPGYQLALACGLWLALTSGRSWRALGVGLGCLFATQIGFIVGAALVQAKWDVLPHALVARGWAIGAPVGVALLLFSGPRPRAIGRSLTTAIHSTGAVYVVDASGCDPAALRSPAVLRAVCRDVIESLGLTPVGTPMWHTFPGEGGVTGIAMLSESHLSVHTYPEQGFAAFDLYCCRPHAEWPWKEKLTSALGARDVTVRVVQRG